MAFRCSLEGCQYFAQRVASLMSLVTKVVEVEWDQVEIRKCDLLDKSFDANGAFDLHPMENIAQRDDPVDP